MKKRINENNPVIKKNDLDKTNKLISEYLSKEYPSWLIDIIKEKINSEPKWFTSIVENIIRKELKKNPTWFNLLIEDIVASEITKKLRINLSGYNSIEIKLTYNGKSVSSVSKYHPRGK